MVMKPMDNQALHRFIKDKHCTLLGVGPMSENCIDATIALANEHRIPLVLIASRRQIDSEAFGGGYVNNWATSQFAQYVRDHDEHHQIVLARDHGGPWQNTREIADKLNPQQAMESAKNSFLADLEAGFQVLHIDTSIDIHAEPNVHTMLERNFELYEYSWSQARRLQKDILFEIGTEEQSGGANTEEEFEYILEAVCKFCTNNRLPKPAFIVVQIGTRVMERKNIGEFTTQISSYDQGPSIESKITRLLEICSRYGILMKVHNVDYLPNEGLKVFPRIGIHSANVAPEFGVTETLALITVLRKHKLDKLADQFLRLAYESRKWEKWMLPDNVADDTEKAIIAGHYVFAHEACKALKSEAAKSLIKHNIGLDSYLKDCVKLEITRYLKSFNLLRQ